MAETPFDFGRVFQRTADLTTRNFRVLFALALVFYVVPAVLISRVSVPALHGWEFAVAIAASLAASCILQGATTRVVMDDFAGKRASFARAWSDGNRHFLPLLALVVLSVAGIVIGLLFFLIPGVLLALRWTVAAPALVVERLGPFQAMTRSADLTEEHRINILGVWAIYFGVSILFTLALRVAGTAFAPLLTLIMRNAPLPPLIGEVISSAFDSLIPLVNAVGYTVIYLEVRGVREGVGVDELAKVFE